MSTDFTCQGIDLPSVKDNVIAHRGGGCVTWYIDPNELIQNHGGKHVEGLGQFYGSAKELVEFLKDWPQVIDLRPWSWHFNRMMQNMDREHEEQTKLKVKIRQQVLEEQALMLNNSRVKLISSKSCSSIYEVDGTRLNVWAIVGGTIAVSFEDHPFTELKNYCARLDTKNDPHFDHWNGVQLQDIEGGAAILIDFVRRNLPLKSDPKQHALAALTSKDFVSDCLQFARDIAELPNQRFKGTGRVFTDYQREYLRIALTAAARGILDEVPVPDGPTYTFSSPKQAKNLARELKIVIEARAEDRGDGSRLGFARCKLANDGPNRCASWGESLHLTHPRLFVGRDSADRRTHER